LSPSRQGADQGPLPPFALSVSAAALRQQFQRGLGARFLSRIRRRDAGRPAAVRAGEKVAARNRARRRLASSTGVDPAALAGRIVIAVFRLGLRETALLIRSGATPR